MEEEELKALLRRFCLKLIGWRAASQLTTETREMYISEFVREELERDQKIAGQ